MIFWLGEIWSNFCENKFLRSFFLDGRSLASETSCQNVDPLFFIPICMQRSKNQKPLWTLSSWPKKGRNTHPSCGAWSPGDTSQRASLLCVACGEHRWTCDVLPVTGRHGKGAGLLKVTLCVNDKLSYFRTYIFLVPQCPSVLLEQVLETFTVGLSGI